MPRLRSEGFEWGRSYDIWVLQQACYREIFHCDDVRTTPIFAGVLLANPLKQARVLVLELARKLEHRPTLVQRTTTSAMLLS